MLLTSWMANSCKRGDEIKIKSIIGEDGDTIVGSRIEGEIYLQDGHYDYLDPKSPNLQKGIGNYYFSIQKERRKENTGYYEKFYLVHHLSYLKHKSMERTLKFDTGAWHFDQIKGSSFSFVYFEGAKIGLLHEPRVNSANIYNTTNNLSQEVFAQLNPKFLTNLHLCQHLTDLNFAQLSHLTQTKIRITDFLSCNATAIGDFVKIEEIPKSDCDGPGCCKDPDSCWSDCFPPFIKAGCSASTMVQDSTTGQVTELPGNANGVICGIMPVNDDFYYFLLDSKSAITYFYKRNAFASGDVWAVLRELEYGNARPFSIIGGTTSFPSQSVVNIYSVPKRDDFEMYLQLRLQINNIPISYTYLPDSMKHRQKHLLGTVYRTNTRNNQKVNMLFMCQGNYDYQCDLDFQKHKIILRFEDYRSR